MARIGNPKDPIVEILPQIYSKAISLAFKSKLKENLRSIVNFSNTFQGKSAEESLYDPSLSHELRIESMNSIEIILTGFCNGLLNSNSVSLRALDQQYRDCFGAPKID